MKRLMLWQKLGAYRWPLVLALLLHLCLLVAFSLNYTARQKSMPLSSVSTPIQAKLISGKALAQKAAQEKQKRLAAERRRLRLQKQRARAARIAAEKKRQARLAAKRRAEQKAREKKQAIQKAQARKRLALAKKKAALAAKKKQQAEAARKKAKALARQKQLKRLQAQQQALEKQLLAKQVAAEKSALQAVRNAAIQREVDRYKQAILGVIAQHWLVPKDMPHSLSCQLRVRLGPGGVVLSVHLLKSSGSAVLDRSAMTAVYKASPLPVPKDPAVFDKFRELRLTVRPETILG